MEIASDIFSKMNIVREWCRVTQTVTTKLSSSLPMAVCSLVEEWGERNREYGKEVFGEEELEMEEWRGKPQDWEEGDGEWGEQNWELADWEEDFALGLGTWNWARKPVR